VAHVFKAKCRTAVHASIGEWRRMEVHACIRGRGRVTIAAPIPATSATIAAPIAMRRRPRLLTRLRGRVAFSKSTSKLFVSDRPETERRFGPAGRAGRAGGSAGRRLLHVGQTPSSPAAGVYKAPHVEHPTTEPDGFMLRMYRTRASRFPANSCAPAALPPTIAAMNLYENPPVAFLPQQAHGLPGRIGFSPAPGRWPHDSRLEPAQRLGADLACLRDTCGAGVLVTLLEEEEMGRIGLGDLLDGARSAGLETLWFPIRDDTAPSNIGEVAQLVGRVLEHLAAGRTVVIHCHAGIGRSGTLAACCLVGAGVDPRRAIELVREGRPGAATAPGQEAFVYQFAQRRAVKR
jgi:protein-tyrosine phosphatase